jgi:hypothetical protein
LISGAYRERYFIDNGEDYMSKSVRDETMAGKKPWRMRLPAELMHRIFTIRRLQRFRTRITAFESVFAESRGKWTSENNRTQLEEQTARFLIVVHHRGYFETVYRARCADRTHDFPWCLTEIFCWLPDGKVQRRHWYSPCSGCSQGHTVKSKVA